MTLQPGAADAEALLADLARGFDHFTPLAVRGRVSQAVGMLVQATGIQAHVGELCELRTPGEPPLLAEVVGFRGNIALLTPLGPTTGLSSLTEVVPSGEGPTCAVGSSLLGRVLDGLGQPRDGRGPLAATRRVPVRREPVDPILRRPVDTVLATGVRAIDALLTLGEGQRMAVFSPPGVGKSTLLGMVARGSTADVNVVALVGERGREVREFLDHALGEEGLARSVVVVATSDRPPAERIHCAQVATTIAEHFRDQGQRVLLMVDSLTRFARAQREIGLACGEPPTRRSYPPSTFSVLPQLLERAGQGTRGSITAMYTVLTEGEADNDPIAEEVRSIVDGHIVLSPKLAEANHFPAIDPLASLSRVMSQVAAPNHRQQAGTLRTLMARWREVEMLVQIGEYKPGADALTDRAVQRRDAIARFLRQGPLDHEPYARTLTALQRLVA